MHETNVEFLTNSMNGGLKRLLAKEFHASMNTVGSFVFRKGSKDEASFRLRLKGADVGSGTVIKCTAEGLNEFPYFYFHARYHSSILPSEFIASGSGCLTDEPPLCWIGSIQDRVIPIDTDQLSGVDMVSPDFITSPAITIVSKRCKDLLQRLNATGCNYIPCVDAKSMHDSRSYMLDQVGDSPSHDNAAYYQLVVTASVKKLPCVGKLLSVAYECEKCGAVGGFSATKMIGEFDQSDLNECDFQTYHGFRDDTGRQYIHKVEHLIISSRILQEFAKAGFTGIDKYASEPMIYRAIVIRDQ